MAGDPERPDPNALLEAARREGRGRLKIFLGAAPGVGKTYAMLESARRKAAEGVDVVVGIAETHGRRETEALLEGMAVLPRRLSTAREPGVAEFDIDAALRRRPGLLLVDELAHSNAIGSRHPKRHQDVEELLEAGIDVWTTLNIQHLESLNDVVARITGVRVRETLPDAIVERADEVELVDLTVEDLLERLKVGKVYAPETAMRAAQNFFRPGNLTALRELALRHTAARVDDQMVGLMRRQAIGGPWAAGERILVCVAAHPDPAPLVRGACRLAAQLDAPWIAVHFELGRDAERDPAATDRVAAALRLAEELGAEARTLPASDLVTDILRFARNHNVTQIVLAKSVRPRWRERLSPSLVHELMRASDAVAIHVLSAEHGPPSRERLTAAIRGRFAGASRPGAVPYAAGVVAVAIAALAAFALETALELGKALPLVFLMAVLVTALREGLLPSIFVSVLSVLAYDFLFIEPRLTLTVSDPEEALALLAFLVAAIVTSNLTARSRAQAQEARRRYKTTARLNDFSRKLAAARDLDDLLWVVVHQIATMLNGQTVLLLPQDERLAVVAGYPPEDSLEPGDWAAANRAWTHGEATGRGSDTLPTASRHYRAMRSARGSIGVLGLRLASPTGLDPENRRLLEALIDQAAVAIERHQLDQRVQETRVLAESERLRSALLSSISHDLGTPLATITAAASALRTHAAGFGPERRAELIDTIHGEAERLGRFVNNLLDMTRLEGHALTLRRDWVDLRELVGSAIVRVRRQFPGCRVEADIAPGLPLLHVDYVLFEQLLFNLMDNAIKYGAAQQPVVVRGRRVGDRIRIEVADAGPGIPPADLERVFEKFYRVRADSDPRWGDRQAPGTGLGLAICRGVVEAHGGTIRAVSPVADGHGTCIEMTLPDLAQPAQDERASSPGRTGST
ncbi:MAG: sensor histidine kinase KdpD [Alphaproteobacteria bacterium]|nr:sensor histidine kinase KdpD [Alphaproteobacteria bacterium]